MSAAVARPPCEATLIGHNNDILPNDVCLQKPNPRCRVAIDITTSVHNTTRVHRIAMCCLLTRFC
jgi:hypothetical protein